MALMLKPADFALPGAINICPLGAASAVLHKRWNAKPLPSAFTRRAELNINVDALFDVVEYWDNYTNDRKESQVLSVELAVFLFGEDLLREGIRRWKERRGDKI